jgi:hypothetical protein
LDDIVFIIRKFKPDVIITRFSKTRGGHGHHLASAILAEEAFFAAADPEQFPRQLKYFKPWQTKRIVWDSWAPSERAVTLEIGKYNQVLGKSYQQIAAESRSMHKSQGFGASIAHGKRQVAFEHIAGDSAIIDIFDDIDISWSRIPKSARIKSKVTDLIKKFNPLKPDDSIPQLVKLYKDLNNLEPLYWKQQKQEEVKELIRMCAGIWLEAIVWEKGIDKFQPVDIRTLAVNRSPIPAEYHSLGFNILESDTILQNSLTQNEPVSIKKEIIIPEQANYFQPYWLRHTNDGTRYAITDRTLIGQPENSPSISASFNLKIIDQLFSYIVPVKYRETDPAQGEIYKPFHIRPQLSITIENSTYVFPKKYSQTIRLSLKNYGDSLKGKIVPVVDPNWQVIPKSLVVDISSEGQMSDIEFKVTPLPGAQTSLLKFELRTSSQIYNKQLVEIDYAHITPQLMLIPAEANLVKLDIDVEQRNIGYIMGSGDDIPQALRQLGYPLILLTDNEIENSDLSRFDVIICGIRAFNTRDILERQQQRLVDFVENGGTWIVQHNTRFGNRIEQIGPYPFTASGRDRIAEEDAMIQILLPDHELMNYPNKISSTDFDGWVQERGLYFADNWEGKLYPILSGHDKGEPSKLGGLLYAKYGKGVFIYTAFSWFRQLPAGVPGAYRIFVNLISARG